MQSDTAAMPETEGGEARTLAQNEPSADSIRTLLTEWIEQGRESLGYVCGIEDTGNPRLILVGQSDTVDGRPLDGDSVFEIGSITKVFTALLLVDMTLRSEVALADPHGRRLCRRRQQDC